MEWQPIETAPRDGSVFDAWHAGERLLDCKFKDGVFWMQCIDFFVKLDFTPSHWMSPPPPPKIE